MTFPVSASIIIMNWGLRPAEKSCRFFWSIVMETGSPSGAVGYRALIVFVWASMATTSFFSRIIVVNHPLTIDGRNLYLAHQIDVRDHDFFHRIDNGRGTAIATEGKDVF